MKKILLATSALVAMSGVAFAGDPVPVAPTPVMPAGFTVTATGEAVLYGYSDTVSGPTGAGLTPVVAAGTYTGLAGSVDATLKAEKTLDDGATVSLNLEFNGAGSGNTAAYIKYSSSIGTFMAGAIEDNDDHGVSAPSAAGPSDAMDEGTFAKSAGQTNNSISFSGNTHPTRITYASPEFGGFKFGVGTDGPTFDAALAGSFVAGDATIKVGASAAGNTANFGDATNVLGTGDSVKIGASVAISGFTIGGQYKTILNGLPANDVDSYAVGVKYTMGDITAGIQYKDGDTATSVAGSERIVAGVVYKAGDLEINGRIDAATVAVALGTNAYVADLGVKYKLDAATIVLTGKTSNDGAPAATTTNTITAGVDYTLNSNVTVGAGVTYVTNGTDTDTTIAAGVKVKF